MKLLSIIIPVYKVEKYIRKCLDSVIVPHDQMGALEVIVVNDGTPDRAAVIAHEYADKYPDIIRVIDKENGGHGSAWNVGLKHASGKYTRFLDSDDWLSGLSDFMMRLESAEEDMVFTHISEYLESEGSSRVRKIQEVDYGKVYDNESFSFLSTGNTYQLYGFWYCTYKTAVLQRASPLFVENVCYDDSILFIAPFILGRTIRFLDMVLYNYRLGRLDQSVSKVMEKVHHKDYLRVCRKLVAFSDEFRPSSQNQVMQRDEIMSRFVRNIVSLYSFLPYGDYARAMEELELICRRATYIRYSPKMRFYRHTPAPLSWACFQLFNKYALKIING